MVNNPDSRVMSESSRVMPGARTRKHSLWRRPLWLAFVFGCMVSATASGRLSVRLIADGALSFAFVPAFEVAALAVVCGTGVRARLPFAEAVDRSFAGNTPWLVWMTVVAAAFAVVPPRSAGPLLKPALFGSVVPLVWSGFNDFRFFRDVMRRDGAGARRDVALQRLVGWGAVLTYFFGIAAWHEYVRQIPGWLGL
jgi:hypothetical protein